MIERPHVIDVALVHHPVRDRLGHTIATAIHNVDVHDIARSCHTYGVRRFHVVTPISAQQAIAQRILDHWRFGEGAVRLPQRGHALESVGIASSIEEVVASMTTELEERPRVMVTSAQPPADRALVSHLSARARFAHEAGSTLLILGNGHGLTDDVIRAADDVLAPIYGAADYNHLSVRAAGAILLDRLLGRPVA